MTKDQLSEIEQWTITQLKKGPQDSGFCQRVIEYARQRVDFSLSNADGVTLYLTLHKQLGLKTKDVNGHFSTFDPSHDADVPLPAQDITKEKRYKMYMNSSVWRLKAKEARARDHYQCAHCQAKDDLEIHHLTYERFGHELPSDLLTLCPACHKKADIMRQSQQSVDIYNRRIDGWATMRWGENWEDGHNWDDVAEAFEEWLDRQEDN